MLINENKILRYLAKTKETLHHLIFETDEIEPFEAEGKRVGKQNNININSFGERDKDRICHVKATLESTLLECK